MTWKQKKMHFLTAFLLTVIAVAFLVGFIAVDKIRSSTGGDPAAAFDFRILDKDTALVQLMGMEWIVGGEPFAQIKESGQSFFFLLPPHVRLSICAGRLADAALADTFGDNEGSGPIVEETMSVFQTPPPSPREQEIDRDEPSFAPASNSIADESSDS